MVNITILDAVEQQKAQQQYDEERVLHDADSMVLVDELIRRGVQFSTIWGRYYEHEEASNGRDLTVGDARLVYGDYEQLRLF